MRGWFFGWKFGKQDKVFSSQTEVFGKISCSDSAFPLMIF